MNYELNYLLTKKVCLAKEFQMVHKEAIKLLINQKMISALDLNFLKY
jgi:hypothetical protein